MSMIYSGVKYSRGDSSSADSQSQEPSSHKSSGVAIDDHSMSIYRYGQKVTVFQAAAIDAAEQLAPHGSPLSIGAVAEVAGYPQRTMDMARKRLRLRDLWLWPNAQDSLHARTVVSDGLTSCRKPDPTEEELEITIVRMRIARGLAVGKEQSERRPRLLGPLIPCDRKLVDRYRAKWRKMQRKSRNDVAQAIADMSGCMSRGRTPSSPYIGVTRRKSDGKWCGQITDRHFRRGLGVFETPEEAARAYDRAARERWGEGAKVNFPEGT